MGARRQDPHHIAAIAHHFHSDPTPEGEAETRPRAQEAPRPAGLTFAVAAAGSSALASFAVTRFSHARSAGPPARWLDLGVLTAAELVRLETAGLPADRGREGLVWCLRATEACSLRAAYFLGRLAAVWHPAQVLVLVFPESWAVRGEETGEGARADAGSGLRLAGSGSGRDGLAGTLAAAALGGRQVEIAYLADSHGGADPGTGSRHLDGPFRTLAGALLNRAFVGTAG